MSTPPPSPGAGGERLGCAWDALSAVHDWSLYAFAYQALARDAIAAGIAIWQGSVTRCAQSQRELGAALAGACHGYLAAWESSWRTAAAPGVENRAGTPHARAQPTRPGRDHRPGKQ